MADLKPCPFCGGDDLVILPDYADRYVYCINCGTCGPSGETQQETIKAWNQRAYNPMKIIEVNPSFREAVEANDGYCPCMIEKTPDTKCMCKAFREQTGPGKCHCGRFEKVVKGGLPNDQ